MTVLIRILLSVFILGTSLAAFAYDDVTIAEMVARAEAANANDKPNRYIEIAQKQLKAANHLYDESKFDEARAAVEDIKTYSVKGAESAIESGKKLKKTEISIRKMASKLSDIKRTIPFDDQAPVQATIDRLEELRTALLDRMFRKDKKK